MPHIGTRKLQFMLAETLQQHNINIGRDRLFDLLADYGMLVRRRRRKHTNTTDSNHPFRKYPNLIRELQVLRPNQLWVSDITYLRLTNCFCYLSLVTDAYSRKIVGYCLYPNLKKEGPISALQMAFDGLQSAPAMELIHHSDRGLQYCCNDYTMMLKSRAVSISMTEKGDPYENALAERVNETLKIEFELEKDFPDFETAKTTVEKTINIYNKIRPHESLNRLTPEQASMQSGPIPMKWKKIEKKKQLDEIVI